MGSALPKGVKKGSGLIDCGIRIAEFKIKKKNQDLGFKEKKCWAMRTED
jgi:hypothetical protein